jgi:hypothetical protein
MNPDALSRQAIRLAKRKSEKTGRPLSREDILRLRVQTVEPWKRVLIMAIGVLVGAFSFMCYRFGAPEWLWAAFSLCAIIILLCGAFGRKSYLDRELQKLADDGPTRILDAIINGML